MGSNPIRCTWNKKMYENCKIYGPYINSDGREFVQIKENDNIRSTSLARYLYEKYYDVRLNQDQVVHHIDGDFHNNNINNLKLMNRKTHHGFHSKLNTKSDIELKCVWCGKTFFIKGSSMRNRNRRCAGPFCSRSCSGKYGAELRNKKINKEEYKNK